jgi:hypothetical protein
MKPIIIINAVVYIVCTLILSSCTTTQSNGDWSELMRRAEMDRLAKLNEFDEGDDTIDISYRTLKNIYKMVKEL